MNAFISALSPHTHPSNTHTLYSADVWKEFHDSCATSFSYLTPARFLFVSEISCLSSSFNIYIGCRKFPKNKIKTNSCFYIFVFLNERKIEHKKASFVSLENEIEIRNYVLEHVVFRWRPQSVWTILFIGHLWLTRGLLVCNLTKRNETRAFFCFSL